MQQHSFFREKKILLIDSENKNKNDRTWCFWETTPGLFQEIVYKEWSQIDFYSESFSGRWDITPYVYKMIRGIDFYQFVMNQIESWKNVTFLQASVENINSENNRGFVKTYDGIFSASFIFNSILFQPQLLQAEGSLLQHFAGWMIETDKSSFNPSIATFMDFRISTLHGDTFVYVLPVTEKKALIEYTVFSPALLKKREYAEGLQKYIAEYLSLENYRIVEEEFGVIPMSNYTFAAGKTPVVQIGTAGGQTKGSSGYTFQFIQKHSAAIIKSLIENKYPAGNRRFPDKRFKLYDDALLSVLYHKKLTAAQIFSDLFRQNKPQQLFKFLDNETTVAEELKIMMSVPSRIFMQAVGKQLFK